MDITTIITSTLISGSITTVIIYISKKLFESRLSIFENKLLFRHNKLYTEKLTVLKELFKRIVIAEKSLEYMMRPIRFSDGRTDEELEQDVVMKVNSFYDYFDENEIILDENIISIVNSLRSKFSECWKTHQVASIMKYDRGSEEWKKSIDDKKEIYEKVICGDIPSLKQELINSFQKQLKISEIE